MIISAHYAGESDPRFLAAHTWAEALAMATEGDREPRLLGLYWLGDEEQLPDSRIAELWPVLEVVPRAEPGSRS